MLGSIRAHWASRNAGCWQGKLFLVEQLTWLIATGAPSLISSVKILQSTSTTLKSVSSSPAKICSSRQPAVLLQPGKDDSQYRGSKIRLPDQQVVRGEPPRRQSIVHVQSITIPFCGLQFLMLSSLHLGRSLVCKPLNPEYV
ncbi:unnamed protein product [Linum trigynum]|uniref:Uncharacterized protein n=1 Tax=Linum trigynum TaxID=586398 RepID=A0AAV2FKP1_9ROSI